MQKNKAASFAGKISGRTRHAACVRKVEKIKDRWALSSQEWPTAVLLAAAGVSLNTAKKILGRRPLVQSRSSRKRL